MGTETTTKPSWRPVVPKMCYTARKGSATNSQGIRGYISVMVILKFISLFKEIVLLQIIDEIL